MRRARDHSDPGFTAVISTVIETRDDVKWLKRAVQALLDHNGISVVDGTGEDDA